MTVKALNNFIKHLLKNVPQDWLKLTTHRLDIYHEEQAKTEFLEHLETLFNAEEYQTEELLNLPTAYDYIRLGHPLSSVLEWALAKHCSLEPEAVISFASQTMPILAILRTHKLEGIDTRIFYQGQLPQGFDEAALKKIYGYNFSITRVNSEDEIPQSKEPVLYISPQERVEAPKLSPNIDFRLCTQGKLGSILYLNTPQNKHYVGAVQHVRRRESIAMTPANCWEALHSLVGETPMKPKDHRAKHKQKVQETIQEVTATQTPALLGSCGLSMQYAIMLGLLDQALEQHPAKDIKLIVPPNCYGGTNDQARRFAAAQPQVEVLDLPVDGDNDMVQSTEKVLQEVAKADAVPFIIAEIPTNPRVEVPDLEALKATLQKERTTPQGTTAVPPVFILDQTFCPNVQFLGDAGILASVQTVAYVSGSKFPSGGKCTAGYCVANQTAAPLMPKIEKHLKVCDNEATDLQIEILAEQLPSMNARIAKAYQNTRAFVNFIEKELPSAKINFVSKELAQAGFTPSVFSLDLPTKGDTAAEREAYKRQLNKRLITKMITEIPSESKYCVSYGQLKGCYWTIPATSTQGTTKEADKDYIARVSVSPNFSLDRHQQVFADFVEAEINFSAQQV
jgi:cystathionine beta-lyase/cystathionine gamma-synthase